MSADMLIATIAVPAGEHHHIDYDAGRKAVEAISDPGQYKFDDIETEIDVLLTGVSDEIAVFDEDGRPQTQYLQMAGLAIIANLEEALVSREVDMITAGGYEIYLSGGLSWGDAPTDAAEAIWDAHRLPVIVLEAMGFITDCHEGESKQRPTDTDIVDAIALGLGTRVEWSGADELEWIADTVAKARSHPGGQEPDDYIKSFATQRRLNPIDDPFLRQYLADDLYTDD